MLVELKSVLPDNSCVVTGELQRSPHWMEPKSRCEWRGCPFGVCVADHIAVMELGFDRFISAAPGNPFAALVLRWTPVDRERAIPPTDHLIRIDFVFHSSHLSPSGQSGLENRLRNADICGFARFTLRPPAVVVEFEFCEIETTGLLSKRGPSSSFPLVSRIWKNDAMRFFFPSE